MDGGIFNNGIQMPVQLQKVNEPVNWQQVHIQASIAAMQAQLSSFETMESITKRAREHNLTVQEAVATLSVDYADALIAELKGGKQ